MKRVGSPFRSVVYCLLAAVLVLPALPARAEEKTGGMQMQVRRTGPPVKIVRPARGPDIVYLRGEQLMQKEEEQARLKYAVRPTDNADEAEAEAETTEAVQKTVYKPLKRPGRIPAAAGKAVAKPVTKNASKKVPAKVAKASVGPRVKKTAAPVAKPAKAVRAAPKPQPTLRAKTKVAASI